MPDAGSIRSKRDNLVKCFSVGYYYPALSKVDFAVKGGQKVVITGFNEVGKSALLKTLVGQIPSIYGHYKFSDQVIIGYFEQGLICLDIQAKDALKAALTEFAGTILLVSYEKAFYREWAQRVINIENV